MVEAPALAELQRWMKFQIQPGASSDSRSALASTLNPQAGDPGIDRLAVYAGGYLARFQAALDEVYEAAHHVLGHRAFGQLAAAYARTVRSTDYNLSRVGRHLPEFLRTAPVTEQLPFLPDLAWLEWRVAEAFHAAQQPPFDPQRLAGLSPSAWERLQVVFQPSVALVASAWPIRDIWQARTQPAAAVNVDLVNRPQRVLVFREGLRVRCELIEPAQALLLTELLPGRPLGDACAALADATTESPVPVADWFAQWAQRGLVVDCRLQTGESVLA